MNDLGNAFSFPFRDRDWATKFVVGALFLFLSLLGIGIFIIAGYLVQLTQRVMKNDPQPLPDWTDIGVKFVIGLKFCIVYFLYLLPVFVLIMPALLLAALGQFAETSDAISLVMGVYLFGLMLFILPYSIAFTLLLPIITYRFAAHEKIGEALDVAAAIRNFKANWQTTTVVALLTVGVQSLAVVGLVFFIIGVVFTIFYSYIVSAYLTGALYRGSKIVEGVA
jgi:hypothetical protein